MKNLFCLLLIFELSSMSVIAESVRTNNCLQNLYETRSEVVSVPTNVITTKPKRKLFRRNKNTEQTVHDIIVPVETNGFVVFPILENKN